MVTGSLSVLVGLSIILVYNKDVQADRNDARHQSVFIFPRDFVPSGRQKVGLIENQYQLVSLSYSHYAMQSPFTS